MEAAAGGLAVRPGRSGSTTELGDGTQVVKMVDGTTLVQRTDGTSVLTKTDGTQVITQGGVIIETQPDGTRVVRSDGDVVEIRPSGVRTIVRSDGITILEHPDGQQEIEDAAAPSLEPAARSDDDNLSVCSLDSEASSSVWSQLQQLSTEAGGQGPDAAAQEAPPQLADAAPEVQVTPPEAMGTTASSPDSAACLTASSVASEGEVHIPCEAADRLGDLGQFNDRFSAMRGKRLSIASIKTSVFGAPLTRSKRDGSTLNIFSDESTVLVHADGSEVYTLPSGIKQVNTLDGNVIEYGPDGKQRDYSSRKASNDSIDAASEQPEKNDTLKVLPSIVIREAYLHKEGGNYKSWKRRFFQLDAQSNLNYYDKPGGRLINTIDLHGAQISVVAKVTNPKWPFCFVIVAKAGSGNKRSKYQLCSDSDSDRLGWVEAIRKLSQGSSASLHALPPQQPSLAQKLVSKVAAFATTNRLRQIVSKKKIRFQQEGFDLDLTYITDRVIAMGYPSEGAEAVYRNRYEDVYRFLEFKHKNAYRVYNLCSERSYPPKRFHNRVAIFPFDDHTAPEFDQIIDFCEDVEKWLRRDPKHVIAVHCKAGKGRTGCLLSCFLLHSGVVSTADEALKLFGDIRTEDGEGVTIPSQLRYVRYFELHSLRPRVERRPMLLRSIYLNKMPAFDANGANPYVHVVCHDQVIYKSEDFMSICQVRAGDPFSWTIEDGLEVDGDMRIEFYDKDVGQDDYMCYLCINTRFVTDKHLRLERTEVDKAHKPKHLKKFDPNFLIELCFSHIESETEV